MQADLSALVPAAPILGAMDITAPRPELWTRIAALLGALRTLLRGAVPEHFGRIATEARAQLLAASALVRRYIHVLAAEITLPEPRPVGAPAKNSNETPSKAGVRREALFCLIEQTHLTSRPSTSDGADTPFVQWALMMEAARRLAIVLNHPEKHALRLARMLRRRKGATLKDLPIPGHILRRLAPWTDALILRLDEAARPEAWSFINSS